MGISEKVERRLGALVALCALLGILYQGFALRWTVDDLQEDVAALHVGLSAVDTKLSASIAAVKTELSADIRALDVRLTGEIANVREEMHTGISDVRTEMRVGLADVREEISDVRAEMSSVHGRLDHVHGRLDGMHERLDRVLEEASDDEQLAQSSSPLSLTEMGEEIAHEINAYEVVDKHLERLAELVADADHPYELQMRLAARLDWGREVLSAEEFAVVRAVAFARGMPLGRMYLVLGLLARDALLPRFGWGTPCAVDPLQSWCPPLPK